MSSSLRVASWNVNSLRVRLTHVLDWLEASGTDLLALQETKLVDEQFPVDAFNEAGYDCAFSGQKTYNGVATMSRAETTAPAADVVNSLTGADDEQRRYLATTHGDWRIVNVYVPNGQAPGSDKFAYKLDWLAQLRDRLASELEQYPKLILLGDFNIAPDDRDVYDPAGWEGAILCTDEERAALGNIVALGLSDTYRQRHEEGGQYSWWDYRAAAFRRNRGLRIDLLLASAPALESLADADIDPSPRKLERPSDHAPIVAQFSI